LIIENRLPLIGRHFVPLATCHGERQHEKKEAVSHGGILSRCLQTSAAHSCRRKKPALQTLDCRFRMLRVNLSRRIRNIAELAPAILLLIPAAAAAPLPPVILKSPQLEAILDPDRALPSEYRLLAEKTSIHGDDSGRDITVTVFRAEPRAFDKITVRPASATSTATRAARPRNRRHIRPRLRRSRHSRRPRQLRLGVATKECSKTGSSPSRSRSGSSPSTVGPRCWTAACALLLSHRRMRPG
jgi:hypothetical protein